MNSPIFALVGDSDVGKTTCMIELVKHFNGRLGIIKSITTRAPRSVEEDPHDHELYDFMDRKQFEFMRESGKFVQCDEPHPGNWKASSFTNIREIVNRGYGICALTERGVINHHRAGYVLAPIRITADRVTSDPVRRAAEAARPREPAFNANIEVLNSFEPGGLARTLTTLVEYLTTFIGK